MGILGILLKVIKRIYDKNPKIQELIDASLIDVCTEETVLQEQVFSILFFFSPVFIRKKSE